MHNTYAVMIRRQDSPTHEQGAFVQLRGVIVPTELGIHVGQNGDGISCSSACKKSRANRLSSINIAYNLSQDDSQAAVAVESRAFV